MDSGNSSRIVLGFVITCGAFILGACGAGLSGTYTNPTGLVTLDLRSGGKAFAHHDGSKRAVHLRR